MIFDTIEHAELYGTIHLGFQSAFHFIRNLIGTNPQAGRYEIDGARVYAMVQRYDTQPAEQIAWEAHQKYIDIQYVLQGNEKLGYAPIKSLLNPAAYSQATDNQAAPAAEGASYLNMKEGSFAILYPQDAHKPRCVIEKTEAVCKVVVKVLQQHDISRKDFN